MRNLCLAVLISVLPLIAYANSATEADNTTSTDARNVRSLSSSSALSNSDLSTAKLFGLNATQWARYKRLSEGPVKYIAPHLDPISVLGNYARSDKERRELAELAVRHEYVYNEHMLAWVRAVANTWRHVYPDVPLIDSNLAKSRMYGTPMNSQQSRLEYYTRLHGCDACDAETGRVLAYASALSMPLDIYVVGNDVADNDIRKWAKSMQIDPAKVWSHTITLNHDGGRLKNVVGISSVPAFIRNINNGSRFKPIDVARHGK